MHRTARELAYLAVQLKLEAQHLEGIDIEHYRALCACVAQLSVEYLALAETLEIRPDTDRNFLRDKEALALRYRESLDEADIGS